MDTSVVTYTYAQVLPIGLQSEFFLLYFSSILICFYYFCNYKNRQQAEKPIVINIGTLIREKLEEQQQTIVWLSKQLCCSRTNVYKILNKNSIDTNELMRISKILHFNFFEIYAKEFQNSEDDKDIS